MRPSLPQMIALPDAGQNPEERSTSRGDSHHFWLWVMCLTGVDYFSTLGYQPSIAFGAAGRLAPIATVILVLVTLFCALPVYRAVAAVSPHGQGSIAMLERLLPGWWGKLLVLVLLGFAATDFVITKTLSAADAAEHLRHNPYWQELPLLLQNQLPLTMALLVLLGGVFLRGFREVIVVAVAIVSLYLVLNAIVIGSGLWYLAAYPSMLGQWWSALQQGDWAITPTHGFGVGPVALLMTCVVLFPKLALGLSGFETGVAVMPLVQGDAADTQAAPTGRIRNTRRLLLTAAVIMSAFLLGSSLVTCLLIPGEALSAGGAADGRALAHLAHGEGAPAINPWFGTTFGAGYDAVTVAILWFAGASAMSGLLNIIPRYLPRYGMAPRWVEAWQPLVILLTVINLVVTFAFDASVSAQGAAYATGVMVLMLSASVAVTIDRWRKSRASGEPRVDWRYTLISCVFLYTTVAIIIEKPDGLQIAAVFIAAIVATSIASRVWRSREIRFERFDFVDESSRVLWDTLRYLQFPVLVPHRAGRHSIEAKEAQIRSRHRLSAETPVVFVEASLGDTSEFTHHPRIEVLQEKGRFVVRVANCSSIAHAIASVALELAKTGEPPELHFGWSNQNPLSTSVNFVLFGEGNVPWLVRELIRRSEPDPARRPRVIIG